MFAWKALRASTADIGEQKEVQGMLVRALSRSGSLTRLPIGDPALQGTTTTDGGDAKAASGGDRGASGGSMPPSVAPVLPAKPRPRASLAPQQSLRITQERLGLGASHASASAKVGPAADG